MAFQPEIEEPSNIVPSVKISGVIMLTSKVTCCILPRMSVNRRSTNWTSLSLISFIISSDIRFSLEPLDFADEVFACTRRICQRVSLVSASHSNSGGAGFASADAHNVFDIEHKDLAVADLAGLGRSLDGFQRRIDLVVGDHHFDF
jgi:hypothetical protein